MKFKPHHKMETHRVWEKVLKERVPNSTTHNRAGHWLHEHLGPKYRPDPLIRSAGKFGKGHDGRRPHES